MHVRAFTAIMFVLLVASWTQADIIDWNCDNDGDGAINCVVSDWADKDVDDEYQMTVVGDQFWGPGHMDGSFTTDTPTDPTIRIINSVDNETGFDWTSYTVNVTLSYPFAISGAAVLDPGDWTVNVTQPVQVGASYVGVVEMLAGTPIGVGETFDFKYTISFSGATSYTFQQEMVPAPEPMTLALLAIGGGLGLLARRRAR